MDKVLSTAKGVGHQPHDAVRTASGTVVVTNELGGGVVFVKDGTVLGSLPAGPFQPGGVAAVGNYAAVADVQGNGVWVYDGGTRQQVAQAPVGVTSRVGAPPSSSRPSETKSVAGGTRPRSGTTVYQTPPTVATAQESGIWRS